MAEILRTHLLANTEAIEQASGPLLKSCKHGEWNYAIAQSKGIVADSEIDLCEVCSQSR